MELIKSGQNYEYWEFESPKWNIAEYRRYVDGEDIKWYVYFSFGTINSDPEITKMMERERDLYIARHLTWEDAKNA